MRTGVVGAACAVALVALVSGACAGPQPTPSPRSVGPSITPVGPSPTLPETGEAAELTVVVENRHSQPVIEASSWFASVTDASGTVVDAWRIAEEPVRRRVPAGLYRLQAWTVYESDYLECTQPPQFATPACNPATMAPSAICSLDVSLTPGLRARVTYRIFDGEKCQLVPSA